MVSDADLDYRPNRCFQLVSYLFSNRPSVDECFNHKWLTADTTPCDDISQPILSVQSLNVTITAIPIDSDSSDSSDSILIFDEDKENSVKALENGEKETSTTLNTIVQQHIASAVNSKLRLEKSSSISLFPDAPTTPKVCRKAPSDENTNSFLIPVPST